MYGGAVATSRRILRTQLGRRSGGLWRRSHRAAVCFQVMSLRLPSQSTQGHLPKILCTRLASSGNRGTACSSMRTPSSWPMLLSGQACALDEVECSLRPTDSFPAGYLMPRMHSYHAKAWSIQSRLWPELPTMPSVSPAKSLLLGHIPIACRGPAGGQKARSGIGSPVWGSIGYGRVPGRPVTGYSFHMASV